MEVIKSRLADEFENRFKSNGRIHIKGWETVFLCLDPAEASLLEMLFSESEIRGELMGADGNKAPSSDGFTFKFAQKFWPELKKELLALFTSSFIPLIPKVGNPSSLINFRPVSLLGCVHKLVTRDLATRLKRVIEKLV